MLEVDPSAHVDADRTLIMKLPASIPRAAEPGDHLSTGGVAADANGFFHPLGDHAQVSFVIDGQPISDQQSKVFSTQLPTSAIQSMEIVTGTPDAEFGDKTSLVAQITTRSGLGAGRSSSATSMRTYGIVRHARAAQSASASATRKSAISWRVDGTRSGRFLDTPEFTAVPRQGNNQTIFDRFDLPAQRKDVVPPEPVRRAQLDPDSEQLRPAWRRTSASACDLEHRARLPAHLQRSHAVDHQSVHPQRPVQLLRQPRSVRRHAGHAEPGAPTPELGREERSRRHSRAATT